MIVCDLEKYFGALVDTLPETEEKSCLISSATLPQLPTVLRTPHLVIRIGRHGYHSYTHTCVDELHVQAYKRTYRLLGLCLLAKIFHPEPCEVRLQLTNIHSDIRVIVLDYAQTAGWNLLPRYDKRPHHYRYEAHSVSQPLPGTDERLFPAWLRPLFTLTDSTKSAGPCDDARALGKRDTVHGVGSDYGTVIFADLQLNLGRVIETATWFALEGEYGFGGVGQGSAEITLWLPGGNGWLDMIDPLV